MKKEIDHECTDEITCPHCGSEFSDSWEYGSGDDEIGLIECGECEKLFYANRNVSVSYSTEKAKYGTCKGCKSKKVVIEDYNSSIGRYKDLCLKCGELEKLKLQNEYIYSIKLVARLDNGQTIKENEKC